MKTTTADIYFNRSETLEEFAGALPDEDLPWNFHRSLPFYKKTQLHSMPTLAYELGVKDVLIKDESDRFNLNSFKPLGAGYALYKIHSQLDKQGKKIIAASAGNHGIGVAFFAKQFNLDATILVPKNTPEKYKKKMSGLDANVVSTELNYDQIVEKLKEYDDEYQIVSDTAWDGYNEIPTLIKRGYQTIFEEIREEIQSLEVDDLLIILQAGVGTFAASCINYFTAIKKQFGRIRFGIVESESAACLKESAKNGSIKTVTVGNTKANCLACGCPNPREINSLIKQPFFFASVSDEIISEGINMMNTYGMESSFNGAISLALLLDLTKPVTNKDRKSKLDLTHGTTILIFNTEGVL